jgi:hypothetical protein
MEDDFKKKIRNGRRPPKKNGRQPQKKKMKDDLKKKLKMNKQTKIKDNLKKWKTTLTKKIARLRHAAIAIDLL